MADNDRALELMQLAVDHATTEEQRAELDRILAGSAEARETFRSLSQLVEQLEAVPMAEAPGLRPQILERLRRAPAQASPAPNVTPFRARRRVLVAAVYAVAAAIAIGVAIDRLADRREHQVVPDQAAAALARLGIDEWPAVASASSPGATVVVRRQGDLYAVQAVAGGEGPVTVAWDPAALALSEILPPGEGTAGASGVTFGDRNKAGAVVLRRREGASGPAAVWIVSDERELVRATINF